MAPESLQLNWTCLFFLPGVIIIEYQFFTFLFYVFGTELHVVALVGLEPTL